MNYEEFREKVKDIEYPKPLALHLVCWSLHLSMMPIGAFWAGDNLNGVVKIPARGKNSYDRIVDIYAIHSNLFEGQTGVTDIILSSAMKVLEPYAFAGCTNLKKITLGKNILKVGENAFLNCAKLEDVYFEGSEEEWKKICEKPLVKREGNDALFSAHVHYNCNVDELQLGDDTDTLDISFKLSRSGVLYDPEYEKKYIRKNRRKDTALTT